VADIILHHYPQSPFSEKIRAALGFKGASWHSTIIPRMMPKPDLMPLTGGYRRTPVMQIGADVYCDTQCILRELERRIPAPTLFPAAAAGSADALCWWIDRTVFWAAAGTVFAHRVRGGTVPPEFLADRSRFLGREFSTDSILAAESFQRAQLTAFLGWAEQLLSDGRDFVFGAQPSIADFALYNPCWFIRQHLGPDNDLLAPRPALNRFADRMERFGNGTPSELTAAAALDIARAAEPAALRSAVPTMPAPCPIGSRVSVTPDDTGRDPVTGVLVAWLPDEIVIRREDERAGTLHQHFPMAGYNLAAA